MAFSPYLRLQHPVGEDGAAAEDGAANQHAPSHPDGPNQEPGHWCQSPCDMKFWFGYTAQKIVHYPQYLKIRLKREFS